MLRILGGLGPARAAPAARLLSSTSAARSNVGSAPIIMPESAKLDLSTIPLDEVTALRMRVDQQRHGKPKVHLTQQARISGPRGQISVDLADFVEVSRTGAHVEVRVREPKNNYQRAMWGTTRTLLQNGVVGVTEGHLAVVKFVGTGFRATLVEDHKRKRLDLRVGYCDTKQVPVPADLEVKVPVPHRVLIEGCDKQRVKLLAAEIRRHRKPEPYKGKGIFVDTETITLKQRKVK